MSRHMLEIEVTDVILWMYTQ